jgi:hypothetical protein
MRKDFEREKDYKGTLRGGNCLGDLLEEDADMSPSVGKAVEQGEPYLFLGSTVGGIVQVARGVGLAAVDCRGDNPLLDGKDRSAPPYPP